MSAMNAVFEGYQDRELGYLERLLRYPISFLVRVFGCWHREMSRPFKRNKEVYRACLDCGAHRHFDVQSWKMNGRYYFNTPRPLREIALWGSESTLGEPVRQIVPVLAV
jgi:hypothetical protein